MIKWVCSFSRSYFCLQQHPTVMASLSKDFISHSSHGSYNEQFPCSTVPGHSRKSWLVLWPSLLWQKTPGGNVSSAAVACGFMPCCYLPLAASCLTGSFPRVFHHRKFPVGKHLASKQRVPWYKRKVCVHAAKKKKKDKKKTKQPPDETIKLKFCSQGYSSNVRISCCLTLLESCTDHNPDHHFSGTFSIKASAW